MPPEVENRSRNRRLPHRPADTAQPHLFKRFQTGLVRAQETAGTHVHQRIAAARFNGVAPGKRQIGVGEDRKSVVEGKSGSVSVDLGGCRFIKKKKKNK